MKPSGQECSSPSANVKLAVHVNKERKKTKNTKSARSKDVWYAVGNLKRGAFSDFGFRARVPLRNAMTA
jgi:hypothetical protein